MVCLLFFLFYNSYVLTNLTSGIQYRKPAFITAYIVLKVSTVSKEIQKLILKISNIILAQSIAHQIGSFITPYFNIFVSETLQS